MTDSEWDEARDKWIRLQDLLNNDENASFYARDSLIHIGNDDHRDVPELIEDMPCDHIQEIHDLLNFFFALTEKYSWKPYQQELSMLALDESLCPMHYIDYAICFDDDTPDCATIRDLFPNHDT